MEIRLQTLGPPRCYANGALTDLSAQKLRFALLIYLAMQRSAARESVAAIFWPESDEEHARRTLAQTLYQLRRKFGDGWIGEQPDPLEVTPQICVDALEFEALAETGQLGAALALYGGDFLAGFHIKDAPEFDAWLDARRRDLKRCYQRTARKHIEQLRSANDIGVATAIAQQWVALDPLDDEANHAFIELLANSGKRSAALAHFESYQRRIKGELDVQPLEHTLALIAGLRESRTSAPATLQTIETPAASSPANVQPPVRLSFLAELKQRRVPRMAAWYVAMVFLVLQAGQTLVEVFYVPRWALTTTAALAVLGFPLTLVLSWYFEITADGRLVRDRRAGPFSKEWRVVLTGFVLATSAVMAAFVRPLVRSAVGESGNFVCLDGSPAPCTRALPIERNRYVVLPLSHADGTAPELDGEMCARLLTEGLLHWHDINIVDRPRVTEALLALPAELRAHLPVDTALALAGRLGAGKLITGELWHHGDTTRVDAYLYDVITGRALKRRSARFASGSVEAERIFRQVAGEFVVEESKLRVTLDAATATTSFAAMQALDSALVMVDRWDLTSAEKHFRTALQRDPAYPHAHLGLAHVMLWKSDTSDVWRMHADRALAAASALAPPTRLLAAGIAHLANRRFAESCAAYRQLLARDALSFYGWFGLGECLRRDPTVVPDVGSPSGFAFASSWQEAINAHERALWLVPSFNVAFINLGASQLEKLLFHTAGRMRAGSSVTDTLQFGAWPELVADTLSLVPYRYHEWSQMAKPLSAPAVVQNHRDAWSRSVAAWAEVAPENSRALEALAWTLEYSGRLMPTADRNNSALAVLRRARQFETDRMQQLRLAAVETRVLFKAQQFREAQRVAQQTLRNHTQPTAGEALLLAGLAGLTGQGHRMVRLLVTGADSTDYDRPLTGGAVDIPPPVARATAALLGYAYMGAPADSIRSWSQRAHATLSTFVAPERRAVVHQTGLDRAARMAFPVLGVDEVHADTGRTMPFISEQGAWARGDTAALRRKLEDLDLRLQRQNPTDFASDGVLTYAQLRLALGDTVQATAVIDRYLADLPNLPRYHFGQPYQPPVMVRLMALRAQLAARNGDRAAARQWSRAVVDLWQDGDRELQPMMRQMRSLARF